MKSTTVGSHKGKARAGASRQRFHLTSWRECRRSSATRSASVDVAQSHRRPSRVEQPRASRPRSRVRDRDGCDERQSRAQALHHLGPRPDLAQAGHHDITRSPGKEVICSTSTERPTPIWRWGRVRDRRRTKLEPYTRIENLFNQVPDEDGNIGRRRSAAQGCASSSTDGTGWGRAPWRQRLRNGSSRAGPDRKELSVCPNERCRRREAPSIEKAQLFNAGVSLNVDASRSHKPYGAHIE